MFCLIFYLSRACVGTNARFDSATNDHHMCRDKPTQLFWEPLNQCSDSFILKTDSR